MSKLLQARIPLLMTTEIYRKPKNYTLYVTDIDPSDIPKEKASKRQKRRARFTKHNTAEK